MPKTSGETQSHQRLRPFNSGREARKKRGADSIPLPCCINPLQAV
jgi:hypothetical protein